MDFYNSDSRVESPDQNVDVNPYPDQIFRSRSRVGIPEIVIFNPDLEPS